jgi:hypothetical protein
LKEANNDHDKNIENSYKKIQQREEGTIHAKKKRKMLEVKYGTSKG